MNLKKKILEPFFFQKKLAFRKTLEKSLVQPIQTYTDSYTVMYYINSFAKTMLRKREYKHAL